MVCVCNFIRFLSFIQLCAKHAKKPYRKLSQTAAASSAEVDIEAYQPNDGPAVYSPETFEELMEGSRIR